MVFGSSDLGGYGTCRLHQGKLFEFREQEVVQVPVCGGQSKVLHVLLHDVLYLNFGLAVRGKMGVLRFSSNQLSGTPSHSMRFVDLIKFLHSLLLYAM